MFKGGNDVHTTVHCRLPPIWIRLLSILEHSNGIKQCSFSVRFSMGNNLAFGIRSITCDSWQPFSENTLSLRELGLEATCRQWLISIDKTHTASQSIGGWMTSYKMVMKMIFGRLPTSSRTMRMADRQIKSKWYSVLRRRKCVRRECG